MQCGGFFISTSSFSKWELNDLEIPDCHSEVGFTYRPNIRRLWKHQNWSSHIFSLLKKWSFVLNYGTPKMNSDGNHQQTFQQPATVAYFQMSRVIWWTHFSPIKRPFGVALHEHTLLVEGTHLISSVTKTMCCLCLLRSLSLFVFCFFILPSLWDDFLICHSSLLMFIFLNDKVVLSTLFLC